MDTPGHPETRAPAPATRPARALAALAAPALIAAGLAGFFRPDLAGVAGTTPLHNLLHLVMGAAALYFGVSDTPAPVALAACEGIGAVFVAVGAAALAAWPRLGGAGFDLTAALHLALGGALLAAAAFGRLAPRAWARGAWEHS